MRLSEILSCHIILLLAWRCSAVSGGPESIDEELDQIATASVVRLRNVTANQSALERPFPDVEITTIRYENSNGFVPMTRETQTVTEDEEQTTFDDDYNMDRNFTTEEHLSLFVKDPEYSKDEEPLENDPIYSTEARIFFSLMQPTMNRRSSNAQDSSDDFELLRINNDTPSVANYENFYNSLTGANQHASNKGREVVEQNTQPGFYQDRQNLERNTNYFDNTGREKKAENYGLNYGNNAVAQNPRNVVTGGHYFSYRQTHDDQNKNGYKESGSVRNSFPAAESFDFNSQKKEKTTQNFRTTPRPSYNQHNVANYHFNAQSPQKIEPITDVTYHQRQPKQKSSQNVNRPRLNAKQHEPPKAKSASNVRSNLEHTPPRSTNYRPKTRSEESPSYFEHEALFNREETNHNYEKTEEDKELSDENYEYVEIVEKPKRFRKQRKRPSDPDDSTRLPKEHRDFEDSIDIEEHSRPRTRLRPKIRHHKPKVNTWPENEGQLVHEDDSDEGGFETGAESTVNTETRKQKFYNQNHSQKSRGNSWANVSPNVEISHSSGIEIDQVGKPKLQVVPVNVNLIPLSNFDHTSAIGNSQGFDLSNAVLQNFVTATPIAFNNGPSIAPITSILNTPHGIFNHNIAKSLQNLQNQNIKVQTPVPEVIVGQNTFHNPIQTILVPQQNYQTPNKFAQSIRTTFLPNNQNSYTQNQNSQPTSYNILQQNLQPQNVQAHSQIQNPLYNPNQNAVQNFQNPNANQVQNFQNPNPNQIQNFQNPNANQIQNIQSNLQFNNPHPTSQTYENFPQQSGQAATSNYNVQVNPHGVQGQALPPTQNQYTPQSNVGYSTAPTTNYIQNGNLETAENHGKKNSASGTNGQFLASASLTVGEQIQNQINAQNLRPQLHNNFNQAFRHDNLLPKTKSYVQSAEVAPTFVNLHNQNGQGPQILNRDHHTEQISQSSNAIAQTYKDQNQQILKVANEIFESTLKQLKQLQRSQSSRPNRLGNQNSQSQDNGHFQTSGTKNVEIINPYLRPRPLDQSFINPTENSNTFGGLSLTTAFPIFAAPGFDTSFRHQTLAPIGPLSINGYLDSLTEIGAKDNDLKTSPTTNVKPNSPDQRLEPVLFNPINFVPNVETLKSQRTLNSKFNVQQPLLQGLNLVPLIPGGNFYKNSYFAQEDLISKPKLNTDLQKYAEEMFKESLKTIYNTHKWNNDHKAQGSEVSAVTTSPKVKTEPDNPKFSLPDIKPSQQILEAHFTADSGSNDQSSQSLGHSSKPKDEPKKFQSQTSDFADMLKPELKLPPPIALEPVRFYYKPNIHLNRPTISDTRHPDFKFNPDFGSMDYIHDFLTPPKPNAFVSKSPFNEPIPFPKRRPAHKRPISDNGKVKFFGRPDTGPSRPSSGSVETAASNIAHQSFSFDAPRFEFLQGKPPPFDHENQDYDTDYQSSYSGMRGYSKYPSLTTSSPQLDDYYKPNSHKYDYNHPRMHNLMGLLRKNKRLPPGSSQSYFGTKEGKQEPFENDERQDPTQFVKERSRSFVEEKSDAKTLETNVNSTRTEKSHA